MSRQFLTLTQAGEKLQRNLFGDNFITKRQAIAAGADEGTLFAYPDNAYPVDDDITTTASWGTFRIYFEGVLPDTAQMHDAADITIYYIPS